MATYKYKCENCGVFSVKMKMSEYKRLESCPECNGRVERVFEVPNAMIFKGEGFYVNDYKKTKEPACSSGTCDKTKNTSDSCCSSGSCCSPNS